MTNKLFRLLFMLLVSAVHPGCEGTDGLVGQSVDSKFSSMMLIRNFSPVMGKPGTTVTIRGAGLDQQVVVSTDDKTRLPLTSSTGSELTFAVPDRAIGLAYFYITQGDAVARLPFIVTGEGESPLYLGDQSEVCSTVSFRRLDGSIAAGSKACGGGAAAPQECAAEGQSGCIATTSFPSVQIKGLAEKVAPGKSVAGVSVPVAQNCDD